MSEALYAWYEGLSVGDSEQLWNVYITIENHPVMLICPPIGEYPGTDFLSLNGDHTATWEELMQMPEPHKTKFLKLRVLLPADDTIEIDGLGHVDADQWVAISVDELDLDSDKML